MRRITLPDIEFVNKTEDEGADPCPACGQLPIRVERYGAATQLHRLVAFTSAKGFTIEDIRERMPILDKLEKAKSTLLLEDAEYKVVEEAFTGTSWRAVSPNVLALADAITNAEMVSVDDKGRPNRAQRRRKASKKDTPM